MRHPGCSSLLWKLTPLSRQSCCVPFAIEAYLPDNCNEISVCTRHANTEVNVQNFGVLDTYFSTSIPLVWYLSGRQYNNTIRGYRQLIGVEHSAPAQAELLGVRTTCKYPLSQEQWCQDKLTKEHVRMNTGPLPWFAQLMAAVPMWQGDGMRSTSMHVASLPIMISIYLTSGKSLHLTHAASARLDVAAPSQRGFGDEKSFSNPEGSEQCRIP